MKKTRETLRARVLTDDASLRYPSRWTCTGVRAREAYPCAAPIP